MELAAELGMTVSAMQRSMTERELQRWAWYARTRLLPHRRLELYLAQLACQVARSAGNVEASVADFLISPYEPSPSAPVQAEAVDVQALREEFAFAPRMKKGR